MVPPSLSCGCRNTAKFAQKQNKDIPIQRQSKVPISNNFLDGIFADRNKIEKLSVEARLKGVNHIFLFSYLFASIFNFDYNIACAT